MAGSKVTARRLTSSQKGLTRRTVLGEDDALLTRKEDHLTGLEDPLPQQEETPRDKGSLWLTGWEDHPPLTGKTPPWDNRNSSLERWEDHPYPIWGSRILQGWWELGLQLFCKQAPVKCGSFSEHRRVPKGVLHSATLRPFIGCRDQPANSDALEARKREGETPGKKPRIQPRWKSRGEGRDRPRLAEKPGGSHR